MTRDDTNTIIGLVELSPSAVAPVCQVGDQLELTCNVTGMFLRWTFNVIIESGSASVHRLNVVSDGPDGVPPSVIVNSTTFTTLRLSAQDATPLMSRMIINPVSEGLNGVQVACIDAEAYYNSMAAMATAVTTIQIIRGAGGNFHGVTPWTIRPCMINKLLISHPIREGGYIIT